MKKIVFLTVLALFAGCKQGLDVKNEVSRENTVVRKAGAAENNDGNYTFYFKNGKSISGDCDGYTLTLGGKTVIYEYWQDDINLWNSKVRNTGTDAKLYKTSKAKYCSVTFDTDSLKSVGLAREEYSAVSTIYKDGKKVTIDTRGMYFIPGGKIYIGLNEPLIDKDFTKSFETKLESIGIHVVETDSTAKIPNRWTPKHNIIIDAEGVFFYQSEKYFLGLF